MRRFCSLLNKNSPNGPLARAWTSTKHTRPQPLSVPGQPASVDHRPPWVPHNPATHLGRSPADSNGPKHSRRQSKAGRGSRAWIAAVPLRPLPVSLPLCLVVKAPSFRERRGSVPVAFGPPPHPMDQMLTRIDKLEAAMAHRIEQAVEELVARLEERLSRVMERPGEGALATHALFMAGLSLSPPHKDTRSTGAGGGGVAQRVPDGLFLCQASLL